MDIKRRVLLKGMGGVAASLSLPFQLIPSASHAAFDAAQRKLVVIQLRGGNDGINTVIPMDAEQYGFYSDLRADIALPLQSINPLGDAALLGSPDTTVQLGLHPALSALLPLQEKLAVFPATHSGLRSDTSHFFQFDYFDSGYFVNARNTTDARGWAGRFLQSRFTQTPEGIVSFDFGSQRKLLRGTVPSVSLLNPASLDLGTGSQAIADAIVADIAAAGKDLEPGYALDYANAQAHLFDNALPRLSPDVVDFGRVSGATYPEGRLGARLKQTTDMLLGLPELELVHIEMGGFDTHLNQTIAGDATTGRHADLLTELGDSLAAFYTDLAAADANLLSNVAVVVMSEFGRTADGNGTTGTDHGQAGTWFVLGESVKGGIYGEYPGLAPGQLVSSNNGGDPDKERFWLQQTVDYRDILSELLGPAFLGGSVAQANAAFPGYPGAVNPLGFV